MRQPVRVEADNWVAGDEAASTIGIAPKRIRWLIMNGHLTPATRSDGARGVARSSVDAEARWRREASLGQRFRRVLGYVFTWSP